MAIKAEGEGEDLYVAGIDEAGRGPVLGGMVYGIAWCKRSFEKNLKSRGFADSKQLTPEKRKELMNFMEENRGEAGLDYASDSMCARSIGGRMLDSTRSSLNEIALEQTCRILEKMLVKLGERCAEGQEATALIDTVYVDTLGKADLHRDRLSSKCEWTRARNVNASRTTTYHTNTSTSANLSADLLFFFFCLSLPVPGLQFVVESKADATYPVVSAASIVAKVQRDEELEALASSAVGSGYPGDERTKAWLCSQVDRVFGFKSPLVRFSWSTCKEVLEKSGAVEVTWDCEEEEEDGAQQKLWSSYAPARKRTAQGGGVGKRASKHAVAESSGVGRQSFFRSRKLQKIDAF